MSEAKRLLNSLLWDIYGRQRREQHKRTRRFDKYSGKFRKDDPDMYDYGTLKFANSARDLENFSIRRLIDISAILKVEISLMGRFLERVLISRERNRRHQDTLCGYVDALLYLQYHNVHPKMRFSLSPPPPQPQTKSASVIISPTTITNTIRTNMQQASNYAQSNCNVPRATGVGGRSDDDISPATATITATAVAVGPLTKRVEDDEEAASDYNQWLHAMKLVARLPGGMPPEFRRKLWLSLADKYLKSKNVDWSKEEEKCFCEKWREDDEELGIQIVKDLHRTGSNLCTGPAGSINQAKLKRILLGYARYNPEVGYCQGFNMLGALILQVMEKEEAESMKVMIYLVEGVLPPGYFHGSMGGLQADMAVFRELMQTKLPRLAKHLQKLQGPSENAFEPPLTNVFTMQWFLTMFCTCLPMTCVLRVWDLVLIEGSDVLLRTALVLWSLLEDRVLNTRTADDFYGKMGSFSSELLNGHLIDSNGLIEKVVQLGPIPDIQRLRDKHLYNITPLRHKQGLQFYYDDEEPGSDEESRLAVATVWGMPWGRRGSQGHTVAGGANKQVTENKDRLALDISLLKKQYDRLRERQRQAHIILTTACSTARQSTTPSSQPTQSVTVNQLLMGRPAIVTNKGRRIGPPPGAIPPARKPSLPTVLHSRPPERQLRRGETLHWRDADISKRRRDSLSWKEIKADRASLLREGTDSLPKSQKIRSRMGKSDSSSYSEESDDNEGGDDGNDGSSTDTSLCDDDDPNSGADKTHSSSIENSPKRRSKSSRKAKEHAAKLEVLPEPSESEKERRRPKSWAPSSTEIPFMLMTSDSPTFSGDEQKSARSHRFEELIKEEEDSSTECDRLACKGGASTTLEWSDTKYSTIAGDLATTKLDSLHIETDVLELPVITSTSQLSPMPDIAAFLNSSNISPLPTPKPLFLDSTNSLGSGDDGEEGRRFAVNDDGVTNQYFERVNSVERPTKLDLFYSLNEEDGIRREDDAKPSESKSAENDSRVHDADGNTDDACAKQRQAQGKVGGKETIEEPDKDSDRHMELLNDYSEKSSAAFIAEATTELTTSLRQEKAKETSEVYESSKKTYVKPNENDTTRTALRDDNIPGEAIEHFEESFVKVEERKPKENDVKTLALKKPNTMSSACRKRRDPRRLTLTRSSTIEIEERFQALERRMSEEKFVNDKQRTNGDRIIDEVGDKSDKRIPTTAELEKRLSTLEMEIKKEPPEKKRFDDSSVCRDRSKHESTEIINRPFTESNHKIDTNTNSTKNIVLENIQKKQRHSDFKNGIMPDVVPIEERREEFIQKPMRNHIPSTVELENRFNALERQLSSNGSPSKGSMDLRRDERAAGEKEAETPPNTPTENNKQQFEKGNSKVQRKNEIESKETEQEEREETEKPPLKKLPSTAELEDRFNALERRLSTQKSSPHKTKKEPPDESKRGKGSTQEEQVEEIEKSKHEEAKHKKEKQEPKSHHENKVTEVEEVVKESDSNEQKQEKNSEQEESKRKKDDSECKATAEAAKESEESNSQETSTETKEKRPEERNDRPQKKAQDLGDVVKKAKSEGKKQVEEVKNEKSAENRVNHANKTKPKEERESENQLIENKQKHEIEKNGKKSPPSTEELEKRFKALEKQMSSTSLKSSKETPSSADTEKTHVKSSKEPKSSAQTEEAIEKTVLAEKSTTERPPEKNAIKAKKETKSSAKKEKSNKENTEEQCSPTESQEPQVKPEAAKVRKYSQNEPQNSTKAIKSFEEKCKLVNTESSSQSITEPAEQSENLKTPEPKHVEAFNEKCKEINAALAKSTEKALPEPEKTEASSATAVNAKRRASEPPSTEDLEKRYESLKRRMSTKAVAEKDHSVRRESEALEEEEESQERTEVSATAKATKRKSSEPPSTEDLESRYEALQRRSSEQSKVQNIEKHEISEKRTAVKNKEETKGATKGSKETKATKSPENPVQKSDNKEDTPLEAPPQIPAAPPMPMKDTAEASFNDEQHRALIEEFQSKIKVQPNGENLKPSEINPNRRTTPERQRTTPFDGTSETHANTAFFRSENYEPWYNQSYKMVRRFSDLPSRADLENRLQFLERQLIMKLYKQRCASDSEVASRKHFIDAKSRSADDEAPTTSAHAQQKAAEDLEKRVLALEKQYSENSLKLLEAVRIKEQEATAEAESPRRLSSETVDATGKELVRYVGELEEDGAMKPINISINIKMLLKRTDEEAEAKAKEKLPTAAELEKRLEALEQQLKISRSRRESGMDKSQTEMVQELKKSEEKLDGKSSEPVTKDLEDVEVELVTETPETKKDIKEALNEECKSDTRESSSKNKEEIGNEQIRAEALKAEKTLENQQIARSKRENIEIKDIREKKEESHTAPKSGEAVDEKQQQNQPREEILDEKSAKDDVIQTESDLPPKQQEKELKEITKAIDDSTALKSEPNKEKQDGSKESKEGLDSSQVTEIMGTPTQTAIQVGTSDPNKTPLVLLLDNEPKAVKVRRLTRANTEELENLFQALEKQLSDRNLIKSEDGKLMRATEKPDTEPTEESKALTELSKEIEEFTKADKMKPATDKETKNRDTVEKSKTPPPPEDHDWGVDPIKRHLKRKTVHLPSTKELEARFRSLERQIKLLEDVEKIDVEQRLSEIERKIKLQYSLSHEKDLTKFLELCEGKSLDELPEAITAARDKYDPEVSAAARASTPKQNRTPHNSPSRAKEMTPYTSPSRAKERTPYTSPAHTPRESRSPKRHTSPGRVTYENDRVASRSPKRHVSPGHVRYEDPNIPTTEDLEYRFHALDFPRSKSKESLSGKSRKNTVDSKKNLIHPLEMLLDPSPDEDAIPSTGELEHRIRVLDDKRKAASPSRRPRSRSPTIEDIKNRKLAKEQQPKTPIHNLETLVASPTKKELPTAEELEARMRALEEEHCFDFKMQKSYQEFNQKLKDAVSPSLSFEELKTTKSREQSPRRGEANRSITPKSALREQHASSIDEAQYRSTSPKAIRFRDEEDDYVPSMTHRPKSRTDFRDNVGRTVGNENYDALGIIEENSKYLQRILKQTLTDSCSSIVSALGANSMHTTEGLDEFGSRLMRETSPLQRTGSHTGVPLRTNDNINERLDSIKNTIKSIDSLCEEKPYRKERCQRYIDSLFSDSIHFASKKTSLEDLSRSDSRIREYTPAIRVSDHSQRYSDHLYGRSMGSADSIRSTSPLRAASPLHHRSNRDLRREISPRRRREEEREEYQSRVFRFFFEVKRSVRVLDVWYIPGKCQARQKGEQ
ncbi:titin isoform X4 [Ceratitis capitata]|uniref:titin isoform X4 n=1 Tax=Ceratitis capitata TaxID=7213 RepID=UPI000A10DECF|nr:titin isoform X4 [Ceratitis capitata]